MARIFDAVLRRRKNPRAGPANNGQKAKAHLRRRFIKPRDSGEFFSLLRGAMENLTPRGYLCGNRPVKNRDCPGADLIAETLVADLERHVIEQSEIWVEGPDTPRGP
ncbi:hypothetical protein [Rhodoblastus sp.]|jgi:hypothetical protein|uniref:hypothetical protein n=1 Tax=Rhodoblastus sp. TaxID=1962975 RepID=UPI0025FA1E5E|nr:hypothetical protein [Rhodoblastus sp.]